MCDIGIKTPIVSGVTIAKKILGGKNYGDGHFREDVWAAVKW